MGIVIKDINVEDTITLAILSTALFSEYIEPTKYVNTALGIADWIKRTPAIKPLKFKRLISENPMIGPNITLAAPKIAACVQETTLSRDIPIKIKKQNRGDNSIDRSVFD